MKPILPVATATLLIALAGSGRGFDVTNCNVVVPENDVGVLVADMDCTGGQIAMRAGATLDLAGHTLQGDAHPIIWCLEHRCTITGPGAIVGDGKSIAIYVESRVKLFLSDVALRNHEFGVLGTFTGKSKLRATNVTAEDCTRGGLHGSRIKAAGVTILRSGSGSEPGIQGRINATDIAVEDGLAVGILCVGTCTLKRATVTNNAGVGILSTRGVNLKESTVTGNDVGDAGIDIDSSSHPHLQLSTCGRSRSPDGSPWGVCAND